MRTAQGEQVKWGQIALQRDLHGKLHVRVLTTSQPESDGHCAWPAGLQGKASDRSAPIPRDFAHASFLS